MLGGASAEKGAPYIKVVRGGVALYVRIGSSRNTAGLSCKISVREERFPESAARAIEAYRLRHPEADLDDLFQRRPELF